MSQASLSPSRNRQGRPGPAQRPCRAALPAYLHLRGATYYFKRKIPADSAGAFPNYKGQVWKCLGTGLLERAKAIHEAFNGSSEGRLHFGQVIGLLIEAGVESYVADYRGHRTTYYLANGETLALELKTPLSCGMPSTAVCLSIQQRRLVGRNSWWCGFHCLHSAALGTHAETVSEVRATGH